MSTRTLFNFVLILLASSLLLSGCGENDNFYNDDFNSYNSENEPELVEDDVNPCTVTSTQINNVTVHLFGDVELIPATAGDGATTPKQSFTLSQNEGNVDCQDGPPSGMLVQTSAGVKSATFAINGVKVEIGSTVFFTVNQDKRMTVATIEGSARVSSNGNTATAIEGLKLDVPAEDQLTQDNDGFKATPYELDDDVYNLPVDMLEREIEIHAPLDDEELALYYEYEDLFNGVEIEDADEVFDYFDEHEISQLPEYLINDLGYTDFDDDLEDYFEDELGYDLDGYDTYESAADEDECDPIYYDCDEVEEDAACDPDYDDCGEGDEDAACDPDYDDCDEVEEEDEACDPDYDDCDEEEEDEEDEEDEEIDY